MKERSVVGEEDYEGEKCGRGRRIMKEISVVGEEERCGRGRRIMKERSVVGGGGEVW